MQDYVPAKAIASLPRQYVSRASTLYGGGPLSDGYLKFIVRELKPQIDQRYNVATDRSNTAIMGSSMGGLISLYAINEYPDVFGAAGMVSTRWPLFNGSPISNADYEIISTAFARYLRASLPGPQGHRLYFDHGIETSNPIYARYQASVDRVVEARGYRRNVNWVSRNFSGAAHHEDSWAARVEIPLRFLLPPQRTRP
jgi:predicted alpha/beta superfamily hydrolase